MCKKNKRILFNTNQKTNVYKDKIYRFMYTDRHIYMCKYKLGG